MGLINRYLNQSVSTKLFSRCVLLDEMEGREKSHCFESKKSEREKVSRWIRSIDRLFFFAKNNSNTGLIVPKAVLFFELF